MRYDNEEDMAGASWYVAENISVPVVDDEPHVCMAPLMKATKASGVNGNIHLPGELEVSPGPGTRFKNRPAIQPGRITVPIQHENERVEVWTFCGSS
jgi:hypothetical protein